MAKAMSKKSPTMKTLPEDPETGDSAAPSSRSSCLQTKRSKYICGISTGLALLTIGLLAFFLWPRYPTLYIELPKDKPYLQDLKITTQSPNVLQGLLAASPTNPFLLTMVINNLVTSYSNAYIDINARKVMIEVKILDDNGKELPPIGGTSELMDVTFPKKSNVTMDSVSLK